MNKQFVSMTLFILSLAPALCAQPRLTHVTGSTHKVDQLTGDCDWTQWTSSRTCAPGGRTQTQTTTRSLILGSDLGSSFEGPAGELMFLFGDTIGPNAAAACNPTSPDYTPWSYFVSNYCWSAHDPIARSVITGPLFHNGSRLELLYPTDPTTGLPVYVYPAYWNCASMPCQKQHLTMGGDKVPNSGIFLNNKVYIIVNTNDSSCVDDPHCHDYSVLTTYDVATQEFWAGPSGAPPPPPALLPTGPSRIISRTDSGGHFVYDSVYESPYLLPGYTQPSVVTIGSGKYRKEGLYLAITPKSDFETGNHTVYYAGSPMLNPLGKWDTSKTTTTETKATPLIYDNDPTNPTIGNPSLIYSPQLQLWLLTYDGGHGSGIANAGVYFTYAPQPWGPWAQPQLILNACRDGMFPDSYGKGGFLRFTYSGASNPCAPFGVFPMNHSGPAGPTIGSNDPNETRGAAYAPFMIGRYLLVDPVKRLLRIYYTVSTWNPYAVVLMESDFAMQ